MFFAIDVVDNIPLECDDSGNTFEQTFQKLRKKLEAKFIDRVISNHGLCVYILDIYHVDPMPVLSPNDGRPCYKVRFAGIIFRPVAKEVIYARIAESDATGLKLTTRFFRDIRIPARMLPQPCAYDDNTSLWHWKVETEDDHGGGKKSSELYMELDAQVRFKVEDVVYGKEEESGINEYFTAEGKHEQKSSATVPMLIIGSMSEQGLGLVDWW